MALKEIVDVQISFEIPTVSRAGFGTPLFLTEDTTFDPGVVNTYGSLEEVEEDYATTTEPYKAAEAAFGQDSGLSTFKVAHKDELDSWVDALGNTVAADDDWYCLLVETREASDIEALATNIEAREKVFIAATADADVLDGDSESDIAATLLDLTLSRTALFYHSEAASAYPDVAWAGKQLPEDPGSTTWAFKSLSGIPSDSFSSTERAALRDKRANHYINVAGNNITYEGYTSEPGIFIDLIRGRDWLAQRMAEDILAELASQPKIAYQGGDAVIEQLMRTRLDIAVDRDVITEYEVTVPPASEQLETDRADRRYKDITFEATLAGAVHGVQIRGTLTV